MIQHRLVEALALLPMLHAPKGRETVVACLGPAADLMAADVLRWRDVVAVYSDRPLSMRDRRVQTGAAPAGKCHVVALSPGQPLDAGVGLLTPDGVLNASAPTEDLAPAFLAKARGTFPRRVKPWREYLPEPMFGALMSPGGAPERQRDPPGGAKRLSAQYLPCLFTFGADEVGSVFGQAEAQRESVGFFDQVLAARGGG
jgi:hypothetical protein